MFHADRQYSLVRFGGGRLRSLFLLGLIAAEDEQLAHPLHLLAEDDAGSRLGQFPLKEALVILVMEEFHIARARSVEAILDGHIVDERLRLPLVDIRPGRDSPAQDNADTVIVEALGEAE